MSDSPADTNLSFPLLRELDMFGVICNHVSLVAFEPFRSFS